MSDEERPPNKIEEVRSELEQYIYDELEKELKIVLLSAPWWCIICGEGGNYEGDRPDEYLPPPPSHECPPLDFSKLRGIEVLEEPGTYHSIWSEEQWRERNGD